jgi:hypothetical protein
VFSALLPIQSASPLGNFQLVSEPNSPLKSLITWRGDVEEKEQCGIPPPKGNASGGKATPIDGTSKDSRVDQLSSELKQIRLQRNIDKLKDSRSWQLTSSSSSNEETDASS